MYLFIFGTIEAIIEGIQMFGIGKWTTIRNCFSHGGRIFVDSKKPGGEIRLVLTDYDEDGKLCRHR